MNTASNFFIGDIIAHNYCGDFIYEFSGKIYIKYTDFKRFKYKNHRHQKCRNCKKNYLHVLNEISVRFQKFPNCCEKHKKLVFEEWFNKEDFKNYPKLFTDKLFYTYDHILNNIENEDWKKEIIDFIDYIILSFGQFPKGYGEALFLSSYLDYVIQYLEHHKKENEKYSEILTYLQDKRSNKNSSAINFNDTLSTYNKWFEVFPFGLSIFSSLKNRFSKQLPPCKSAITNKYTGLTTITFLEKEELVHTLLDITNDIICSINLQSLVKQFSLDDIEKLKLELIVEKRRQKLTHGYISNKLDHEKNVFQEILNEWLQDEIEFINEITPILSKLDEVQNSILKDILNACYKMQENKKFWYEDEDTRTKQILDILSAKYSTTEQSTYGESNTGIKAGSVDGIIIHNNCEIFIEALNLNSINKSEIEKHIYKLENKYDSKGLYNKFLIVYCNIQDYGFENFHKKYIEHINSFNFIYKKENLSELKTEYTNNKLILTTHNREGQTINLYHILLKMPKK